MKRIVAFLWSGIKLIGKSILVVLALTICVIVVYCSFHGDREKDSTMKKEITNKTKKKIDDLSNIHRLLPLDQIHREKLKDIQYWTIKKGVAEFYKTRDVSHIAEYVRKRGYGLVLPPQIDEYHRIVDEDNPRYGEKIHTLARFVIQQKYQINQVWCLEQVEHNGIIYEYWVMQERSQGRSYNQSFRNCTFIITKAAGLTGEREIIHSSHQFFSSYAVDTDFAIVFPKDGVVELGVHAYPECFQKTDMKEIKEILSRLK